MKHNREHTGNLFPRESDNSRDVVLEQWKVDESFLIELTWMLCLMSNAGNLKSCLAFWLWGISG